MNVKLSVVVPLYNTEQYLRECLDSLVNQTIQDIEIIVINDGSTDESPDILAEYAEKYTQIRVINQANSGVANAANRGIKEATGKYVILADSDDVVPTDAYEKLYNKAEATGADITIGKGNLLVDGVEKEFLYKKEKYVWQKERVIDKVYDYLDLFYDVFYWNKMFRKEFLLENDIFLPSGITYSDRPMVHKAYIFAKKIAIIPDVVYFWRKRGQEAAPSLSQDKQDLENFQDRIKSYEYQLDYFEAFGDKKLTNEFLIRNLYRLLLPIGGIKEDREFRQVYLKETKELFSQIENIYDNELCVIDNLYIYLILNDMTDLLVEILNEQPTGDLLEENGKYYLALPYFRNEKYNIPDELFEVKILEPQFIRVNALNANKSKATFENISFPKMFPIINATLEFQSRKDINLKQSFHLEGNEENPFSGSIDLKELNANETYDVYVVVKYDEKEDKFRLTKSMFENQEMSAKELGTHEFQLHFTKKGNLSLLGISIQIISFEIDHDKVLIKTDIEGPSSLQFIFKGRASKEKISLDKIDHRTFELDLDSLLEKDKIHDVFFKISGYEYRLSTDSFKEYQPILIRKENHYISSYETVKGNFSIGIAPFFDLKKFELTKDKIQLETTQEASHSFEFFVKDRLNDKKIYFEKTDVKKFELKMSHILKSNSVFDFYYTVFQHEIRLKIEKVLNFSSQFINKDKSFVETFETSDQNLSIRTACLSKLETPKMNTKELKVNAGKKAPESLEFLLKDRSSDESFSFEKTENGVYSLKFTGVTLQDTVYDFNFKIFGHEFRLDSAYIDDFISSFREVEAGYLSMYETKHGNISINAVPDFKVDELRLEQDKLSLKLDKAAGETVAFYLKERISRDMIEFEKVNDDLFEVNWNQFLQANKEYDVYYEVFSKEVRLSVAKVVNFKPSTHKINNIYVGTEATFKNDLYLQTFTFIKHALNKLF